jgi:hypothetical protein
MDLIRIWNVITVYELSGITRELDLSNMIFKVSGYKSDTIDLTVEQDAEGTNVIKANLRAGSITEEMLSSKIKLGGSVDDAAVTTRKLADESVTAAKIAERAITNEKSQITKFSLRGKLAVIPYGVRSFLTSLRTTPFVPNTFWIGL